ncbi:MAG: hypothetical protein ABJO01_09920 [Parasphingorhabdus sp.]|uniref:hypothetical protein n=1 Tax=Parasphingorhabdus sp. TaxID=2709688 RepID=UPI003296E845
MTGRFSQAAETVHGFWSWWSDEMLGMLPASLKGDPTERDRFDIFLGDEETVIEKVVRGAAQKMVEPCGFNDLPDESWEQISVLLQDQKPRLFLAAKDILQIPVTMPRASAGQIRSALTLQLPGLVPLMPEHIDWNFVEIARDAQNIEITLVIARSSRLDELEEAFAYKEIMPPVFCANVADRCLVLRKPLELTHRPINDKKLLATMAAIGMLAMIPVFTIGGAEMLASLNLERAERLQKDLAPKLAQVRDVRREETIRRAAAPLFNMPSAANLLEMIAQNLPESDWAIASSQSADGSFEFIADMANRESAETALRTIPQIKQLEIAEEMQAENKRARVRYRIAR